MEPISTVEAIGTRAFTWQGYEPAVKCDLTSTALDVGGRLVFFDPVALTDSTLVELLIGRTPLAILLTNANHQRDSLGLRDRLRIPIVAPASARSEITADAWIPDGDSTPIHGFHPIHLPGAGMGEVAYHWPGEEPSLIFGDAVIHLPPEGLRLLPDKYCENPSQLRSSIASVVGLDASTMHFAHGRPLGDPAGVLRAGLAR